MKEPRFDSREMKAESIARTFGMIRRVSESQYKVVSQSGKGEYDVLSTQSVWHCSCPDHVYRQQRCKQIRGVELSFILRTIVAKEPIVIEPKNVDACRYCGSGNLTKDGIRHNQAGDIQKFECHDCGRYFTVNIGFEKMKHNPKAITTAMQLYFSGTSLRNTQMALRLLGVNVSHKAVWKWIRKYVGLMEKYLDQLTPQVGDTWRTDELYLKVRGNVKYLFAMMDDDTRFWIAQQISDNKGTSDVRPMFREAQERAGKRPKVLISDGAFNFGEASVKEWYSQREGRVAHVRDIRFDGTVHNNKMERLNGEIRDREKVVRGIKRADSPILKGYQLYHNFIRPHEALNGQTPSERAGIKVGGLDKWLTIIQNASQQIRVRNSE